MADSSSVTTNVIANATDSFGNTVISVVQSNVTESTSVTADVVTGAKGDKGDTGSNGQGVPIGGTTGQVLSKINGTNYNTQWSTVSGGGGGDVYSSIGTSIDNAVSRMDGTTGKIIQSSPVIIDDTGAITGLTTIDGRDVSVDGTKLDGIASGATANTGDMVLGSAQTNTGIKTFNTGTLLMRDSTNTFSSEPYSDSNPPFTLNLSDQTITPTTPVAGQSTLHTTDGTSLKLLDNTGTLYTIADLTSTQTLAAKTLTTPTIGSFINANHNHTVGGGGGQITDAALSSAVTVSKGGTGRTSSTTAYGLIAAGTTATAAHQTLAAGLTTQVLIGGGAAALPVWTTVTGTGAPVLATSPSLTTPVISQLGTASGIGAAFQTWSPTPTNLSNGNGVVNAKYQQIGKKITAHYNIVFGTTSAITGDITLTLPVTAISYGGVGTVQIGSANLFDTSAARLYQATVNLASTTTIVVRPQAADLTYLYALLASATAPFTWATGDEIGFTIEYEAA